MTEERFRPAPEQARIMERRYNETFARYLPIGSMIRAWRWI